MCTESVLKLGMLSKLDCKRLWGQSEVFINVNHVCMYSMYVCIICMYIKQINEQGVVSFKISVTVNNNNTLYITYTCT